MAKKKIIEKTRQNLKMLQEHHLGIRKISVTSDSPFSISSDSTSPSPIVTQSSDVTASDQDQRYSTKTTKTQQCPYFLRSHHQGDSHIDHIQEDARDELIQGKR